MATTATRFDTANDRATYAAASAPDNPPLPSAGWSAAWWVYLSIDRDDYSTMLRLHAAAGASTVLNVALSQSGTGVSVYTVSGSVEGVTALAVGQWYYLAVSVAGSACTVYVFDAAGALTASGSGTISASTQPTGLTVGGRSPVDSSEWFNGRISRMRIWAAALSQAEFAAEQFAAQPVRTAGAWAHYPLSGAGDLVDTLGGHHLVAGASAATTEDGPPLPSGASGSALVSLGALDAAASGRRGVAGAATAGLGALDVAAIASRKVLASGVAALAGPGVSASGRRTVTGAVAATLSAPSVAAVAERTVLGQALATLGPLVTNVTLLAEHDTVLTATLARQGRIAATVGERRALARLGSQR